MQTVTIEEISPALNTEIEMAAASKPKGKKSLTYNPCLKRYAIFYTAKMDGFCSHTKYSKDIQQAVDFYNTINI